MNGAPPVDCETFVAAWAPAEYDGPLRAAIVHSMGIKAKGHDFASQMDAPQVLRFMSMTGG